MYATAKQKMTITRLCQSLGIKEPLEDQPMTSGEAGKLIRRLTNLKKAERKR